MECRQRYAARLSIAFMQELPPISDRISNEDLLKRCLLGLTQNQNESLNGTMWKHRCLVSTADKILNNIRMFTISGKFQTSANTKTNANPNPAALSHPNP